MTTFQQLQTLEQMGRIAPVDSGQPETQRPHSQTSDAISQSLGIGSFSRGRNLSTTPVTALQYDLHETTMGAGLRGQGTPSTSSTTGNSYSRLFKPSGV